jgi:hypothetical protein
MEHFRGDQRLTIDPVRPGSREAATHAIWDQIDHAVFRTPALQ